jgi:hypothetical protein
MKRKSVFLTYTYAFGLAILLPAVAAMFLPAAAWAATSFSNSLTGFTGNSTQPATQTAVGAAGFNFFSTTGLDDPNFTMDPTVVFDANGATFGTLWGGDGGRNYVRTNDTDYATVSFTAQVTIVTSSLQTMDVFLGLGTGEIRDPSTGCCYGWPDWGTLNSSLMVLPEITDSGEPLLTTLVTQNDLPVFANNAAAGLGDGTHRLQLVYDATAKTAVFSIDTNYAGGAYAADLTAPALDASLLYAADGWPTEASSIYFGGDDSAIFKDFSVAVSSTPSQDGDFDGDGDVDGRDFLRWQRGGSPSPLSAGDLSLWQNNYGAGGLVAVSAVPEPSSVILLMVSAICCGRGKRK